METSKEFQRRKEKTICLIFFLNHNSQADSVKGDAISSKARSSSVGDEANALRAEVEEVVKVSIKGVKMRHSELKDLRRRIEGRIDVVKDDLVTFERVGRFYVV